MHHKSIRSETGGLAITSATAVYLNIGRVEDRCFLLRCYWNPNPHVWDRERARDTQADQARGFKAAVKLRRRSIAKLL